MPLPDYTSLVTGTSRATGFSSTVIDHTNETTGSEIDNATNLDEILDCEIVWSYGTAPTANKTVEIWLLYSFDGTNYTTRADGGILLRAFSPPAVGSNTLYRLPILGVWLMPYKFKLHVRNVDTGQSITVTVNAKTRKATQLIE
jgi:hypothetical protein